MRSAAIVGWSGYGEVSDLVRTVSAKLRYASPRIATAPGMLIVGGPDPTLVARRLRMLPGVSWVAAGYESSGDKAWIHVLSLLARRYLRKGSTFTLRASVTAGPRQEGDILLDGISTVLKSVKGSKVDEKTPLVVFRVVMTGNRGAVGVQLSEGPGGVPTSRKSRAVCLVSGGYHSAVMAWLAILSGHTVRLVHARDDDESLRQVARLYAELSKRADPSGLELLVLEGAGNPTGRLRGWLESAGVVAIAASHPVCRGPRVLSAFSGDPSVTFPLVLAQEEDILERFAGLGLKMKGADENPSLSRSKSKLEYKVKRFGERESDINGVLDSILR